MTEAHEVEACQAEVAWIALAAISGQGFALAGAGALITHGLVDRPTQDLDLFSPLDAGFEATVDSSHTVTGADFARLVVTRGDRSVQIDLGRDWRQHPPVLLAVDPVLHLDDAVGNKVDAMIGRGLPRDYLDVAAALRRYDREQLLELGFRRDPGLRVVDVALAMHYLDQLSDIDFGDYHLTPEQTAAARRAFADWPRHPGRDRQGERAHSQAQQILAPPAPGLRDSTRQRPGAPPAPLAGPARPPPPGPTPGPRR